MAGSSSPSTFLDGLQKLNSDIAAIMMLPDADPKFCMSLIQAVTAKAKQPVTGGVAGQGQPPGAGGPPTGPGGPPGAGGGPPPGAPPGLSMPGGPPGGRPANPAMPTQGAPSSGPGPTPGLNPGANNPDEMRRMIQQMTAGG